MRLFLLTLTIITTTTFKLLAWGGNGHKMIASIAYNHLSQPTKDSLTKYLEHTSLEDASVWMDEMRSDHSFDYLKPWHYINIEKGGVYDPQSSNNIIWAIKKVTDELKHRNNYSKEQIVTDLKILIHLIGDLHQPLHVGYGNDKGGNTIQAVLNSTNTNLHRVWDTQIIEANILGRSKDWMNVSGKNNNELAQIRHIDILKWMEESRILLPNVYDFGGDNIITQQYIDRNVPIIERQLLYSGIRLGALLNEIFDKH